MIKLSKLRKELGIADFLKMFVSVTMLGIAAILVYIIWFFRKLGGK